MQYLSLIIGILISLLFSAFFSGMEIAFVSSNRMLAEVERERGSWTSRLTSRFYRHPNNFVSTMLVGNNIALVVYGILFAKLFDSTLFAALDDGSRLLADTVLSTLIVLFTGEFLPKLLFKNNADRLFALFSLPAGICYVLLWPIARFATLLSRVMLRLFGVHLQRSNDNEGFTRIDLDYLVQQTIDNAADQADIDDEVQLFQNALDFTETKVRDCMIPRTEINAVDEDTTRDELRQRFNEGGHSKILVYRGDIDHIVGYIHSQEMFRPADDWHSHLRTLSFVPETMPARKLMQMLLQQKKSLAVVVDEFGGTAGLVALEDIVEEIFGEIEDEHDSTHYVTKQVGDNEYILSARLEIDRLNELFPLNLPESDEYMTLGGFILHAYRSFPKLNEVVRIGRYECRILQRTQTRLELVRLKVLPDSNG